MWSTLYGSQRISDGRSGERFAINVTCVVSPSISLKSKCVMQILYIEAYASAKHEVRVT
jgi:hypothetical protein